MPIVPDTKDWTWVTSRPCPQCGFDATAIADEDTGRLIRENAALWPSVLDHENARQRPDDSTWSPLEYACHVRDVLRVYRQRLALMLTEDDPLFQNWDQDATAIEDRYDLQDPAVVSRELADAAADLADAFDQVSGEQWHRPGRRSDGASFTISVFATYFLHDIIHHAWDVKAGVVDD